MCEACLSQTLEVSVAQDDCVPQTCKAPPEGKTFAVGVKQGDKCVRGPGPCSGCYQDILQCGKLPPRKTFAVGKSADADCDGEDCSGCFQDIPKCGEPPEGKMFAKGKTADGNCNGQDCSECFKDMPRCGEPPAGKVFVEGKTEDDKCVSEDCSGCFEEEEEIEIVADGPSVLSGATLEAPLSLLALIAGWWLTTCKCDSE